MREEVEVKYRGKSRFGVDVERVSMLSSTESIERKKNLRKKMAEANWRPVLGLSPSLMRAALVS